MECKDEGGGAKFIFFLSLAFYPLEFKTRSYAFSLVPFQQYIIMKIFKSHFFTYVKFSIIRSSFEINKICIYLLH